jgi:hypothetical protein
MLNPLPSVGQPTGGSCVVARAPLVAGDLVAEADGEERHSRFLEDEVDVVGHGEVHVGQFGCCNHLDGALDGIDELGGGVLRDGDLATVHNEAPLPDIGAGEVPSDGAPAFVDRRGRD